jgi:hypothetical protein
MLVAGSLETAHVTVTDATATAETRRDSEIREVRIGVIDDTLATSAIFDLKPADILGVATSIEGEHIGNMVADAVLAELAIEDTAADVDASCEDK